MRLPEPCCLPSGASTIIEPANHPPEHLEPANYPSCQRNTARAYLMQPDGCREQHHICTANIMQHTSGASTNNVVPNFGYKIHKEHTPSGACQHYAAYIWSLNYHRACQSSTRTSGACQLSIMPEKHRQSLSDAARRMQHTSGSHHRYAPTLFTSSSNSLISSSTSDKLHFDSVSSIIFLSR